MRGLVHRIRDTTEGLQLLCGYQMTARQYRIHLDGVLGRRFGASFDGFDLDQSTGTVLVGVCVDSSALFGILS